MLAETMPRPAAETLGLFDMGPGQAHSWSEEEEAAFEVRERLSSLQNSPSVPLVPSATTVRTMDQSSACRG